MFNELDRILMLENEISVIINDFDKSWKLLKLLKKLSKESTITYEYYLLNARADLCQGMSVDDLILRSRL